MTTTNDTPSTTGKGEISRLVATARDIGKPDHYTGKRSWLRYQTGMQLEVVTDPSDLSDIQAAIMHNVSGGGFSFWSRKRLLAGATIYLREFSGDESQEWARAAVCHCTVGIRGYLIGAAFEDPVPQDGGNTESVDAAPQVQRAEVATPAGGYQPAPSAPRHGLKGWFGRRRDR